MRKVVYFQLEIEADSYQEAEEKIEQSFQEIEELLEDKIPEVFKSRQIAYKARI